MTRPTTGVPYHGLTLTRLMPQPYWLDAGVHSWSCLRAGCPRPLSLAELREGATGPRWEPRTFDTARRDLVFEAWGGVPVPERRTFDDARCDLVYEAWGVR
jgi:hypothetical protein